MMRERSGWRELDSNHRSRGRPRRSRGIGSRLRRLSVGGESSRADMSSSRNQVEELRVGRTAAPQRCMGDERPVAAPPAGGLDQVPGAEILQPEGVARRELGHRSATSFSIRSICPQAIGRQDDATPRHSPSFSVLRQRSAIGRDAVSVSDLHAAEIPTRHPIASNSERSR